MEIENKYKYYAFISYKREDEEWAKWLQHKLEHYKLPSNLNGRGDLPKEIRPVFKDTSELNPGNLPQQIHDALEQSKYLIVICSPRSAKSEWVNKEVETFMGMGKTDRIIPFIIDGKAFAKDPSEECFPMAIRSLPSEQEILGANIGEMGRDAAAVKVVAQMFGLKFDELWQRHEREQRRKRLLIVSGALLLALIGIGVAIGFSQQNKRIREQNEVILNKNERLQNDSVVMAAQMDSINKRDALITLQQDSLEMTNEYLELTNDQLLTERNNLKVANWKMMENQARFIAERVNSVLDEGNAYLAQRLLLEVLPKNVNHPVEKPFIPSIEDVFRKVSCYHTAILRGHNDWVNSVAFSPDGKRIVSASNDTTVRIWDAESGAVIRVLKGHTEPISNAAFSPDGKRIVSSSYNDKTTIIWDAESGAQLNVIPFFLRNINTDAFSPDGKLIVLRDDGYSEIIDVNSGHVLKALDWHKEKVVKASFSLDGKRIVSLSSHGTIKIWDAKSGVELNVLKGIFSNSYFYSTDNIVFSPDGKRILFLDRGKAIYTWYCPPLQDLIDETRERFKNRPLTPEERRMYYLE